MMWSLCEASLYLAQGCAERPVGAGGGRGGRVRTGHDGTAEGGGGEAIGAAVDHDRDGWGRGAGRMRRGCVVASGCGAGGESSRLIVPLAGVPLLGGLPAG